MADIFSRDTVIGDPFSAEDVTLLFAGGGDTQSLLVQQLTIQYTQAITRAWEIGSNKQYLISGHQEGSGRIDRIVGPKPLAGEFLKTYGDVCNVQSNHITFSLKSGCGGSGGGSSGAIRAVGVVITNVSYSIRAQDMVVNEGLELMITKVEER